MLKSDFKSLYLLIIISAGDKPFKVRFRIGIKYFTGLIKLLTGKKITDPTSGMRMVNKKLLEKFTDEYPKDYPEPESVVTILAEKYKVMEIPVVMNEREEGVSSISLKNSVYYMIKVSFAILIARMKK